MDLETYKVITLGTYGVGKTCILLKATQDIQYFPEGYQCTIGVDFKTTIRSYNEKHYKINLWDTAGQERFHHINRLYYNNCDAVLLVFDITSRKSFSKLKYFYDDFKENNSNTSAFVMVGNKTDLPSKREISVEESRNFAGSLNMPFLECSAFSGEGIPAILDTLLHVIEMQISKSRNQNSSIILSTKQFKPKTVSKCC